MRKAIRGVLSAVFCLLASVAAFGADDVASQAARAGKGLLVLQCGSDWCVSGESVRKVFESSAFKRAVEGKFVLAVYDEMDSPTDEAKSANERVASVLVRTKRFPAITCYAPGSQLRVFAQLENVPAGVSAERLSKAVLKLSARKDEAAARFAKAQSARDEAAAGLYGEGFDLLAGMMGPFHFSELTSGKTAWKREWEALKGLDAGDRYGWIRHFEMDDYKCVAMVGSVTEKRDAAFVESMKKVPQKHFTPSQRQCVKIMEYALGAHGTDKPLSPAERKLMEEVFELGRDTLWGQFAMGRLMLAGAKIESKGLKRAPVRARPERQDGSTKMAFPLESAKREVSRIKPGAKLSEAQKLAIARYAVCRLIGKKGWDELTARRGGEQFLKAFMDDRVWLEDFAWSGTFPANSSDGWAKSEDGPGDGTAAALALESLVYQDAGKWVPFENGRFADNEGRRFMTALAIVYSDKDEAWLADVLDAYRATAKAGRLHKTAYSQPVWRWRFAVHQGHGSASCDNMAAQQRHLDKFVNLPMREYAGACWMIVYRLNNCFGDSVQGPWYYKPWAEAGEWPKRKYSQMIGGVCGELSKFGSAASNAHGLPSTTVGQPAHCAYSRRLADGTWEVDYSVTGHSQMHMCFWNKHPWQYSVAIEGTMEGDRERRLGADRHIALALLAEESGAKSGEVEAYFRQACRSWPTHYGAWRAYGDWVGRSGASLDTMRVWVRGCARGMKTGRQPLWDFLTPYFARLAKEKGKKALADDLVVFAPLLTQSDRKIQEEADFKKTLEEWTKPLGGDVSLVVPVLRAMLDSQYGTKDYFSQVLGWGGDALMGTPDGVAKYMQALGDVVAAKTKDGKAGGLDFNPLIMSASKTGNLDAFRQMASLQNRLEPYKGSGKPYPATDFGGQLLSSEGLLKTSSTSGWDSPKNYARCIDSTPSDGNGFHTAKEKAPWAEVMLPGPIEVFGVLLENNSAHQNRHRQVPLEIQVSEDGSEWKTVHSESEVRQTYRVDLRKVSPRARYVRVRRTPEAKDEVFHLGKILVYGKKLY